MLYHEFPETWAFFAGPADDSRIAARNKNCESAQRHMQDKVGRGSILGKLPNQHTKTRRTTRFIDSKKL